MASTAIEVLREKMMRAWENESAQRQTIDGLRAELAEAEKAADANAALAADIKATLEKLGAT